MAGAGRWLGVSAGLVGASAAAAGVLAYAVRGPGSQLLGRSVFRGPAGRRELALTFDDGPSPGTLGLLDALATHGVRATFFVCGMNVERHPEVVRAVARAGHELGNHTWSHRCLRPRLGWQPNLLSRREVFAEFARTQESIERTAGVRPRWLRAPYGMRWFGLRRVQRELGLTGVHWTTIGHDWEWPAERIAGRVEREAAPGGVICLHDGRETRPDPDITATVEAVKRLLPELRARGFAFRTVSEMFGAGQG